MGNFCGCNNEPGQNIETNLVYYKNIITNFFSFSLAKVNKIINVKL